MDKGVIEAAKSFGASDFQIIFKVMLKEASAFYSIRTYSYNNQYYRIFSNGWDSWRWRPWLFSCKLWISKVPKDVMIVTVIILIIIVQALQMLGNYLYKN